MCRNLNYASLRDACDFLIVLHSIVPEKYVVQLFVIRYPFVPFHRSYFNRMFRVAARDVHREREKKRNRFIRV